MVLTLRFLQRIAQVVAGVAAGVAVAIMLIHSMAGVATGGLTMGTVVGLWVLAALLFGVGVALGYMREVVHRRCESHLSHQARSLSEAERERERLLETPRLAREHGRAERAPTPEDPTIDW